MVWKPCFVLQSSVSVFDEILSKTAAALSAAGVEYMVVGGQAVLFHGEVRVTDDVDITLSLNQNEYSRLVPVLESAGLVPLVAGPEEFLRQTFVLPVLNQSTGIRVDFIFALSGFELSSIDRAVSTQIQDVEIRFISLEDLLVQKIIAGRPRDLEDVRKLLLRNPTANRKTVEDWLRQFDAELDGDFAARFAETVSSVNGLRSSSNSPF